MPKNFILYLRSSKKKECTYFTQRKAWIIYIESAAINIKKHTDVHNCVILAELLFVWKKKVAFNPEYIWWSLYNIVLRLNWYNFVVEYWAISLCEN